MQVPLSHYGVKKDVYPTVQVLSDKHPTLHTGHGLQSAGGGRSQSFDILLFTAFLQSHRTAFCGCQLLWVELLVSAANLHAHDSGSAKDGI